MLHLDDQTMPIYQQKVAGEVKELQYGLQELRREVKDSRLRSRAQQEHELELVEAGLRQVERRLGEMSSLPPEMRDRLRQEVDASIAQLKLELERLNAANQNDAE